VLTAPALIEKYEKLENNTSKQ